MERDAQTVGESPEPGDVLLPAKLGELGEYDLEGS